MKSQEKYEALDLFNSALKLSGGDFNHWASQSPGDGGVNRWGQSAQDPTPSGNIPASIYTSKVSTKLGAHHPALVRVIFGLKNTLYPSGSAYSPPSLSQGGSAVWVLLGR